MLGKLYRPLLWITVTAACVAVTVLLSFNIYFNRAAVKSVFVEISTFVLIVLFFIIALRYALLLWFTYLQHLESTTDDAETDEYPLVSILVPAYNEHVVVATAIESLMQIDYPAFEVIVIDDGSTDATFAEAAKLVPKYGAERLRLIRQRNGGKATALNAGIAIARGELVLCMDADSIIEPQTLRFAVKHFADPSVGAVAGNVKVLNRNNWLTSLQALEYVEGINLVRTAQAFFKRVTIIPGPIGIFRKDMLFELGGYLKDTYAEDCELTLRILAAGWKIKYERRAVAWTEAPESFSTLFTQRYRWSRGVLQALLKHKSQLANPFHHTVDRAFMWLLLFESLIWPSMNLLGNALFLLLAAWVGYPIILVLWFAQLTVLDFVAALFCVALEGERIKLAFYSLLYRVFFIPLLDVIKVFSSLDQIFGKRMAWRKLERTGAINELEASWN